jgi:myo-inositol-hexaphosphate 3-phosphohydrolase
VRTTVSDELRVPYDRLKKGLEGHVAYTFTEDADGLTIYYEPYHTEGHTYSDDMERLFLYFRRYGDEMEFTSFDVESYDGTHKVDLSAAREPLKIWLEYLVK